VFGARFLEAMGCRPPIAREVAEHLVEADLMGVYSHGIFRLIQYARDARAGRLVPQAEPRLSTAEGGAMLVDGGNGLGMPALRLAAEWCAKAARRDGMAAVGVCEVAHAGRIGAFAETMADAGMLGIVLGGGSRKDWRQVVPYGGARAMLPTNPYALALPGGERGAVALDFATSAGAGGKVYAAKTAGRPLPAGLCVDASGAPTTDPDDYLAGGALLPMAGAKGYGLALIAELAGGAALGPARDGLNWLVLAVDLGRFSSATAYRRAAEECLAEIRACPPAPGFARVEVPGERERELKAERLIKGIPLPAATIASLRQAAGELGVDDRELAFA
jgi:LDH2 family malate/lactate/ureidoglycolate dehydrogenase